VRRRISALWMGLCLLCGLTACGEGEPVHIKENPPSDKTIEGLEDIRWGVDITGGVDITFGPSDANIHPTAEQLEAVKTILELRLTAKDITTYEAYVDTAAEEVIVRVPWGDEDGDPGEVVKYLNQTVNVQFRIGDDVDAEGNPTGALILDGTGIAKAEATYGPLSGDGSAEYYISLEMTEAATTAFAQATEQQAAAGGCISIWLDNGTAWAYEHNTSRYEFISAPTVNEKITNGEAVITLPNQTYEEAKTLADILSAGCLPFELTAKYTRISPTTAP